jgi:hypothetical protein
MKCISPVSRPAGAGGFDLSLSCQIAAGVDFIPAGFIQAETFSSAEFANQTVCQSRSTSLFPSFVGSCLVEVPGNNGFLIRRGRASNELLPLIAAQAERASHKYGGNLRDHGITQCL